MFERSIAIIATNNEDFIDLSFKNSETISFLPLTEQLKYIKEAEEIRRAMEPVDLIKRVKQIQLESESGVQSQSEKEILRQKQATELSKRLTDLRSSSDQKALEEWRKRKIERAKKREPISIGTNA